MGINSDDMLLRRLELTRKLHELKQSDRKDVAQKAKVQWAIEGDENSKYFHGIINKRRAQLGIRGVFVNGLWTTEPSSVKKAFVNHFANRFNQPMNARLKLNMMFPNQLTPDQVEDLDRNIANDEIKAAVWACGENKSPGPDGYTFEFFRQYWDIIGSDFCAAVDWFFVSGTLPRGCNSSFIALIPKVTDAKFVTDFRPISLIGSVYKVITKILANRLSTVISDLVSNTQSAFVKDRQILDGPFILNEALAWCKRKKSQALIFKVDFAKAYDSVRWDFLLDVLQAYGFWSQARVKKSLVDGLVAIDKDLDMGINSDDMLLRRLELTRKLHELKQSDRKDVAQKAKVQWAIEGDENSKYFHGIINKRRAQLGIRGVFVNGLWTTEPSSVKKAFVDHFANRFNQPMNARLKLNMMFPNQLTPDQVEDLYFEFFRQYWDIIGSDFYVAVDWFFVSGTLPRGCNSSFIALIPKVTDAKFVTDFRPISLIGSVYKDRQILDGPFILNEALAWCKRKKSQALTKAYDSVSSNMASILMNGSPKVEFLILCGLKQGDPLAPLLFILVMESLHISVSRAVNDGVFKGLHINDSTILSHLFYADDAIFLGEWSDDNLANLIRMLQCFQLASGLKINVHKSQVLGVGVHPDIVNQGASTFGCTVMHTPFKYLGVTVGDQMSHHSAWRNIIQKVRTRLSKWKVKTLSIGGRLTLLKSVLGAVPLYSMSIYKAPKGVLHELEMIRNSFFNGADSAEKKDNLARFTGLRLRITIQSVPRAGVLFSERFWRDSWLVDSPLCTRFPCMYALERNKEISVAVKWGDPSFDHSFCRQARDGVESQQWVELLSLLGKFTLSPSIDRWVSDLNGEGLFRVKDFRSFLDDLLLPSSNMATRWVKCVPIKVNVFVWHARLERLPTRDNLAKRGVHIVSNLCPVCSSFPKDAHNLFFGYQCTAKELWEFNGTQSTRQNMSGTKKFMIMLSIAGHLQGSISKEIKDKRKEDKKSKGKSEHLAPKVGIVKQKFQGTCYNCDQPGHYAANYKMLKRGQPLSCVSWRRLWFHSFRAVDNRQKLYMGNSATADIKGEGDAFLKMTSKKELKLNNGNEPTSISRSCNFLGGQHAINGSFKKKLKADGTIEKYKAEVGNQEDIDNVKRAMIVELVNRDYGLHYDRYPAVIEGYSDANWISDIKGSRSTSGY
ncbi:RNA-directed DNA polymerase, eukaryota [Tanacetum coccineum]